MKFSNKQAAIKFIEASGISIDEKVVLCDLIEKHALDQEIKIIGNVDEIDSILFQSDHDVEEHIGLIDIAIVAHSLAGVSSVTNYVQSKENKMTNEQNNQAADQAKMMNEMEAMIAASMQKIMESSLDSVLEATLAKQQARIDETVKKSVDEAVKKAVDEALKAAPKDAETKKVEEPKKPSAEQTKQAADGLGSTVSKAAMYVAGAAAVATGGYFAWKKWGTGSVAE